MRRIAIILAAAFGLLAVSISPAGTQGLDDLKLFTPDPAAGVSGTTVTGQIPKAEIDAACLTPAELGDNFQTNLAPALNNWAVANGGILGDPTMPNDVANYLADPGTMTAEQVGFYSTVFGIIAASLGAADDPPPAPQPGPVQLSLWRQTYIASFIKLNDIEALDFELVGALGSLDPDTGEIDVTVPTGAAFEKVGETATGTKFLVSACVEALAFDPAAVDVAIANMQAAYDAWILSVQEQGLEGEIPGFPPDVSDPAFVDFALATGPAALAQLITPLDFWAAIFCVEANTGDGCDPPPAPAPAPVAAPAAAPVQTQARFTG
jgi:hypothetical protein